MKNKTDPLDGVHKSTCQECGSKKPSYTFTHLSGEGGAQGKNLCAVCYNRGYTKRAGLPELGCSEFPPITLYDSLGKEHTFHFSVRLTTGLGITAFELIDGYPGGYQFGVLDHPETPVNDLYARLVEKIKSGISVKYLRSSDFGPTFGPTNDRLYIKGSAINGRIEEKESRPIVVVDGKEFTWDELGQFLSSHTGFNFRLQCFDPYDEIKGDPDPHRPDRLWWLERPENKNDTDRNYQ